MNEILFVSVVACWCVIVYLFLTRGAVARRLDSANAAVDAQRERLAILTGELDAAEAARDALAEELTVQTDRANQALQRVDALAAEIAMMEEDAEALPVRAGTAEDMAAAAAAVRDRRGDAKLFEALFLLLDQDSLSAWNSSNGPGVPEAEIRWNAGYACAAQGFKARLAGLIGER